jgi:exodeoxyribonuclease-3
MSENTTPPKSERPINSNFLLVSWNVDGFKDSVFEWLKVYLAENQPSIVCINETKRKQTVLEEYFSQLENYHAIINQNSPANHHGVAMLIRKDINFTHLDIGLGIPARADSKAEDASMGRLIVAKIENLFHVVCVYSQNSGTDRQNPLKNLDERINLWDPALFKLGLTLEQSLPTLIIGDINVAPHPIDVVNPKRVNDHAGFTIEERDSLLDFLDSSSWIDSYRYCYPEGKQYSYRGYAVASPYRMRLDSCLMSSSFKPYLRDSFILDECEAESDHVPIGVTLEMRPVRPKIRIVKLHTRAKDPSKKTE